MQLAIPGISQGEETRETLVASLVFLRLLGSLALLLLFASSRVADTFLSSVAGVQLSVIEILIVISTITQSFRTVCNPVYNICCLGKCRHNHRSIHAGGALDSRVTDEQHDGHAV